MFPKQMNKTFFCMGGNLGPCLDFFKVGFMDFEQLVTTRRTVHNFTAEKVGEEMVVEALRLSLWAPNHKLTFPWVYTLVGSRARQQLADLYVSGKRAKDPSMSEVKAAASRQTILNPSHFISVGVRRSEAKRQHEDYATLACSMQIMSMFLWKQGVATKWTTSGFTTHESVYGILGLNPGEVVLEGALMIGKAAVMPAAPERPKLDSIFRRVE